MFGHYANVMAFYYVCPQQTVNHPEPLPLPLIHVQTRPIVVTAN